MKKKISSNWSLVFQIAYIIVIVKIGVIALIALFLGDLIMKSMFLIVMMLFILLFRRMGIFKLKTVHQTEDSLLIGNTLSKKVIPISAIQKIEMTFLYNYYPYKVTYVDNDQIKKLYFIPKTTYAESFNGGPIETLKELKSAVKQQNIDKL